MALLALSHTPVEHCLYEAMLAKASGSRSQTASFSVRHLMQLTGLPSYSTVRRGRDGLVNKLTIERQPPGAEELRAATVYRIYQPEEVLARRVAAGVEPYPAEARPLAENGTLTLALGRLVNGYELSRREAQVALCCVGGMTNWEIGEKLFISEQTVKFHLRHIFIKCGVRRRTELISHLLSRRAVE
jgi:DNA-binding CsgD family transcriptional regulator